MSSKALRRIAACAAVILLIAVSLPCYAQQIYERRPLAVVESHIITRGDVDGRIAMELAHADETLAGDELEREHRRILEKGIAGWLDVMVEEKLLTLEGRRLEAGDERLKAWMDSEVERLWKAQSDRFGGEAQFNVRLMRMGSSPGKERERMREFLLERLVRERHIDVPAEVTPAEIRAYYRANADSFRSPKRVAFRMIYIPFADFESREKASERADWIRRNIAPGGADFAEWVIKHSKGPRAAEGGLLSLAEWKAPTDVIQERLNAMKAGDISNPIAGPEGMFIFKVETVIPESARPLREVQAEIRTKLTEEKMSHRRRVLMEELRRRYHVEIML